MQYPEREGSWLRVHSWLCQGEPWRTFMASTRIPFLTLVPIIALVAAGCSNSRPAASTGTAAEKETCVQCDNVFCKGCADDNLDEDGNCQDCQ